MPRRWIPGEGIELLRECLSAAGNPSRKSVFSAIGMVGLVTCAVAYLFCLNAPDKYAEYLAGGLFGCTSTEIPSGTGISYCSTPATGNGDIYRVALDDRTFHPIVATQDTEYSPVVSRDGQWIAFSRRAPSGRISICLLNLETKREITVLDNCHHAHPIEISSDNKFLIVERTQATGGLAKDVHTYLVEIATSSSIRVGCNATFDLDHTGCLFVENDYATRSPQLMIFDYVTGNKTRLCEAFTGLSIDQDRFLVTTTAGVIVVDRKGAVVKRCPNLDDAHLLSVGGGVVAGVLVKPGRIVIVKLDTTERENTVLTLPAPECEVSMIRGSSEGFVIMIRHGAIVGKPQESLCSCRPPFDQVRYECSLTELSWDAR